MPFFFEHPDLIDGFRAGDPQVLVQVYEAYHGPLQGVLRTGFGVSVRGPDGESQRLFVPGLRDLHARECSTQEVFIRAFREPARRGFDASRAFGPWLFRIARNLRIDAYRKREAATVSLTDAAEIVDEQPSAEAALLDAEERAMVEAVLTALPERARAYLAHRLVDGLSQVEAAARVSMSRIQGRRIEGKFKAELLGRLRRSSQGGNP